MGFSLRTFLGGIGFCRHDGNLYIGSFRDHGRMRYVYSCNSCGAVYSRASRIGNQKEYLSFDISESGRISFNTLHKGLFETYSISSFVRALETGLVSFSREGLGIVLHGVEERLKISLGKTDRLALSLKRANELLYEEKQKNAFLESVLENVDTVSYTDKELCILGDNSLLIEHLESLSDLVTALLLKGEVLVSKDLYKLFHLLLRVTYGYAYMRKTWKWGLEDFMGENYYKFLQIKK